MTKSLATFKARITRCQRDYRKPTLFICFFGDSNTAWLINGLNHPAGFAHRLYVNALLACLAQEQVI